MNYRNDLTPDELKSMLIYNEITGEFLWKDNAIRRHVSGNVAGNKSVWGYVEIRLNRKLYKAHRLAWLYHYGKWPADAIDHIDGDRANNRIANLREASSADNSQNLSVRKTSISGINGVSYDSSRGMWLAQLSVNKTRVLNKRFKTKDEAARAYAAAKMKYHSFNPKQREVA